MEIKAKYIKVEIIEGNSSYSLEADIKRWLNNHSDDTIYDIKYNYIYCEGLVFSHNYSAMIIYAPEIK